MRKATGALERWILGCAFVARGEAEVERRGRRARGQNQSVAATRRLRVLGCVTAAHCCASSTTRSDTRSGGGAEWRETRLQLARGDDALGRVVCALPFGRGRPAGDGSHADRTQPRLGVGSVRVESERESESFVRRSSQHAACNGKTGPIWLCWFCRISLLSSVRGAHWR